MMDAGIYKSSKCEGKRCGGERVSRAWRERREIYNWEGIGEKMHDIESKF